MAIRRPRAVKSVAQLNERHVPVPPPETFFTFAENVYPTELRTVKASEIALAYAGREGTEPRHRGIRAYIDNPDGITDKDFYPLGWAYNRYISIDQRRLNEEEHAIMREYNRIDFDPDAFIILPYMSTEWGLTLVLTKGRLFPPLGHEFAIKLEGRGEVPLPIPDVFCFQTTPHTSGSSSFHYPDMSHRHTQMQSLLLGYKEKHGVWPNLFPEYERLIPPPPPPPPHRSAW